jgi:hypothetical protein
MSDVGEGKNKTFRSYEGDFIHLNRIAVMIHYYNVKGD